MKKGLTLLGVFLLVFALSVGAMAGAVQEQLIEQMEKEPVSAFTVIHYTWDFLSKAAERFAESAKPLIIFNNTARMGGEITWYEEPLFSLTVGKYLKEEPENPGAIEFEEGWFFGAEIKLPEWPAGTELGKMFSKLRPQILFHQGNWYFGFSYAFRSSVE